MSLLSVLLLANVPGPVVPCRVGCKAIGVGCKAIGKHMVLSVPPCKGCEYVNIDIRSGGRSLEAIYAINNNWFYVWSPAWRGTWTAETTDGRRVRGRWHRLKPFRWRY